MSVVTKLKAMNVITYGTRISEILIEAAKIPINIDMDLINNVDVESLKATLELTRSVNLITYEKVLKKLDAASMMEYNKGFDVTFIQKTFESYNQNGDNDFDFVFGLLVQSVTSTSNQLWKSIVLQQFKNLRDGDSLWYEFKESKEVVDVLSELSLLGFLRKVTGVRSLKVEFNYNEE